MRRALWRWKTGSRGARVTVAERTYGGPAYLYVYDSRTRGSRGSSLGFHVRDGAGLLVPENVARAKRQAAELSNRLLCGDTPSGRATLAEVVELFRRDIVPGQAPRSRAETVRELELWLAFLGSQYVIGKLGLREWHAFIRAREAGEIDGRGRRVGDPNRRRSARARTVAKSLKVLRQLCRYAANYRTAAGGFLLEGDPTRGLPLPVEKNPARPIADHARLECLLAVADRVRTGHARGRHGRAYLRALLLLAADTGRRVGAILALRYSDWDAAIRPHGALRWRADADKSGREWWAPVTRDVRRAIQRIRRDRPGLGDAWLFPAPETPDEPLSRQVATKWLRRAEKLADLPHPKGGGWHSFRRLWATARKHHSAVDTAAAGGWKDTATLQRVYQSPDWDAMVEVVLGGRRIQLPRSS